MLTFVCACFLLLSLKIEVSMDVVDLNGNVLGSGSQLKVINSKFELSLERKQRFDVRTLYYVIWFWYLRQRGSRWSFFESTTILCINTFGFLRRTMRNLIFEQFTIIVKLKFPKVELTPVVSLEHLWRENRLEIYTLLLGSMFHVLTLYKFSSLMFQFITFIDLWE